MSWAIDENQYVYVNPMESAKGNWVKYEDYARLLCDSVHDLNQIGGLQQELAELRAASFVTAVPVEQYERVVKAGDAMAKVIDDDYLNTLQVWIDWNAAKEGKPRV
jgi:hypothetical protein